MLDRTNPVFAPSQRQFPALNGLRGLAILTVMLSHAAEYLPNGGPVHHVWVAALREGWSGVDLFFVLSGFLITGILLDTKHCANYWKSFYLRRALRIFPLYYAFLLFSFLVFPFIVQPDWLPIARDRWLYVCYLMNWQALRSEPWHANVLGHLWSLCIEEQFYLVWPWIVLALPARRMLWILPAVEGALIAARSGWVITHGYNIVLNTATVTRMDGLLAGAFCAVLFREARISEKATRLLPVAGALCLAVFGFGIQGQAGLSGPVFTQSFGFALLAIGFGAFLLWAVLNDGRGAAQKLLSCEPLTRLGRYSYGMYIFHVPLFYFVSRALPFTGPTLLVDYVVVAVKFAVTYVFAALSYNLFEKRILAYKSRFRPQYRKAVPELAVAVQ